MNLPKIQALTAPLSAPIPSALGVASEAFNYFYVADSINIISWFAAIGAFLGIETLGGASCYALVKLHRQQNYGIEFWIAFTGILVYIGSGIYSLADSPIIIFFFLAPFSYFAYSILRSMEVDHNEKVSETEAQIRLIQAQTRQINAEARKDMASKTDVRPGVRPANRTPSGNNETRGRVFDYLTDNPTASVRIVAGALELPKSTVETYVKEFKDSQKEETFSNPSSQ